MAAKATATITISWVIDISSVTRYYLLQSSTLAAPDKPTTNPPSDSWSTVEPSYTPGDTSTLYFVDCTVFTNDTFKYSAVSKSSSYEAAKEAYNKAVAVETRVIDAETSIQQNKDAISLAATRTEVEGNYASLIEYCNSSILDALEDYVQTGDYEAYKTTVEAQLNILADQISMNFATTTEQITAVEGEVHSEFTELHKYINFSQDGIEISSGENTLKLILDNDMIYFEQNGVRKSWWDGNDFHIGNIIVDVSERAQFGNFAFIPRSDGSLMFLKVNSTEEASD